MISRRLLLLTFVTVLPLNVGSALAKVTTEQVEGAETVAEFVELGAKKLSASQFKSRIVGKAMDGDGWSWIIDANGTTSSKSDDGSWAEKDSPWSLKGDKYCSQDQGKTICRDVYMIGSYVRMSDKADPERLSGWTAKIK